MNQKDLILILCALIAVEIALFGLMIITLIE